MSAVETRDVLEDIDSERMRQDERWGADRDHPDDTGGLLRDAEANLAKDACEAAAGWGKCSWRLILDEEVKEAFAESSPAKLRAELVQVAAVAVAWIEALDRRAMEEERMRDALRKAGRLP